MPEEKTALSNEEQMAQHAEKIESLSKGFELLSKENVALKKSLAEVGNTEQAPKVKPVIPKDTFNVKGATYKFIVPQFRADGNIITATDALTDDKLLEHLVSINSGVIQEVAV